MKNILIDFWELDDISVILNELINYPYEKFSNYFVINSGEFVYYFVTKNTDIISHDKKTLQKNYDEFDIKIKVRNFVDKDNNFDICIATLIEEPIHLNDDIISFLDNDNFIITSSIYHKHQHKNIISLFESSLIYFYFKIGYSFLNFYENEKKENLLGLYASEAYKMQNRSFRFNEYQNIKEILQDDVYDYKNFEFKHKQLINDNAMETKMGLSNWHKNHISTYTDYINSVVFLTNESDTEDLNLDYYRISEKTLKSILFCNAKSIPILSTVPDNFEKLNKMGFWFLNSEFYSGDIKQSIIDSAHYLRELKLKYGNNEKIYSFLKEKYQDKLIKNINVLENILFKPNFNILNKIVCEISK